MKFVCDNITNFCYVTLTSPTGKAYVSWIRQGCFAPWLMCPTMNADVLFPSEKEKYPLVIGIVFN